MATPVIISELQSWLTQAQTWLHADFSISAIRAPHQQLLNRMRDAINSRRVNRVWDSLEEMEKLSVRISDTVEQGEIFIELARIAAELENLKEALRLILVAESKYKSYPHQRAVALWMAGCLYWSTGNRVDAIAAWEESIALFQERQLSVQVDPNRVKWYLDMLPDLHYWLRIAIDIEGLPPYIVPTVPNKDEDYIRWLSCPIKESVPAGGFGPVGFDPTLDSHLEIREVVIENELYDVFSTKRTKGSIDRVVSIQPGERYQTIRVNGNSMNNTDPPIEDGDYVLVQAQKVANDNDIVVAEIFGLNPRATIKRLKIRGRKIVLSPDSKYPYPDLDPEREFDKFDDGFSVYGVVKAVFKKK